MAITTKAICIYADNFAAEDVIAEITYRIDFRELCEVELYSLQLGGMTLNRTQAIEMFGADEVNRVEDEFTSDDVSEYEDAA